jgi:transcriptional regulator with XRE-family HTH domain
MLTPTLTKGLSEYAIGERVRTLRLRKKMGLVELGRHTGLSPALLSKIERGRLFPTLPTLLRIALVFGVGLELFFSGAREKPLVAVVRRKDRVRLPDHPGAGDVVYRFESLDFPATERRFNSYVAEFFAAAPEKLRFHQHPGVEFLYVVQGRLGVRLGPEEHALDQGDSMYFDATVPHAYRRRQGRTCRAVVVTAP